MNRIFCFFSKAFAILLVSFYICAITSQLSFGDEPIIIDHTCTNIWQIPESAINQAKANLHIAYDHTSHGAQLIEGMKGLPSFMEGLGGTPGLYDFNDGGIGGALDIKDDFTDVDDLHDYPDWLYATRQFLGWECDIPGDYSTGTPNYSSNYNVVMWMWCRTNWFEEEVNDYLNAMDQLRADYPQVTFVYMTWRVSGNTEDSPPEYLNDSIRQHCIDNNLILYDFGDIERYDPDGNYFGDKRVNDDCSYDNDPPYDEGPLDGNWAIEWQDAHVQDIDWYDCLAPHTQPLNANMKAYASWWLWARLAGWNPNGGPVANFSGTPTTGIPPLEVNFTDSSIGEITSWSWDFDNNGTEDSTDQNPTYTYNDSGSYSVTLEVTGPGGKDTETKTNYIVTVNEGIDLGALEASCFISTSVFGLPR